MTDNWVKKDKIAERQSIYLHVFLYPLLLQGQLPCATFNLITSLTYHMEHENRLR